MQLPNIVDLSQLSSVDFNRKTKCCNCATDYIYVTPNTYCNPLQVRLKSGYICSKDCNYGITLHVI